MKITGVKTFQMRGIERNWTFVKVETDEGLYGWGEGTLEHYELSVEQAIKDLARRYLVGQDPTLIERHWYVMYRHNFWRGGPIQGSAVAALDQALWDIMGKSLNVPVYKLLGGPVRDKIRMYTHANTADEIRRSTKELGYGAFKCTGWYGYQGVDERRVVPELEERVGKYREQVGPGVDIMYDNVGQSNGIQAIQMVRALEKYNMFFFEEGTQPDSLDNLARLRATAGVKTPIATGERLYSRWEYKRLLEEQLADIVQPDVCHCFGISELRRIATSAETYYIRIAPHNPNGPIATAASIAVCAAVPNFAILESIQSPPWHDKVQKEPLKLANGYIPIPTKPGLGVDLDEDVIKSRPFDPLKERQRYYVDGSPV